MKASGKQIRAAMNVLSREVEVLGRFHSIAERAGLALEALDSGRDPVLEAVYEASQRSLLIGLAGVLSTDQESITLSYLLDLASNKPYSFNAAAPERVKQVAETGRRLLESIDSVETRLRSVRDRRLAHLDRKMINDPSLYTESRLDFEETSAALATVEQVLSPLLAAFHGVSPDFATLRQDFELTLDRLLPHREQS